MQLIIILLATVSILTFLSGLIVFVGAIRGERVRSTWYFLAAIFATVWMASISLFLVADKSWGSIVDWHAKWTFVSAIIIDVAFLGYIVWNEKHGKLVTFLFLVLGGIISALILTRPELLYKEVILGHTGNSVVMNIGPLYFAYIGFFGLIVPVVVFSLLKQFYETKKSKKRYSDLIIMSSFGISSVVVLVANLILPLMGNWGLIWLGPLALSMTILAFYYTILRYQVLDLTSIWLKFFSYVVVITSFAIVYMIIFSLIFSALFRGSTPSIEVIILNFIMVIIFLVLIPSINEISISIRKLINSNTVEKKEEKTR
ncbi:hypothetical protein IIY24_00885 [Candidatus Saccharibacteria bacterium]|nr:hypothetical protein [Candidatus Saccharibacteria bacterium]